VSKIIDGTKVQVIKLCCHSHDLFFEAFVRRQIREDHFMSLMEKGVYICAMTVFKKINIIQFLDEACVITEGNLQDQNQDIDQQRTYYAQVLPLSIPRKLAVSRNIISITYNYPKMIVRESNCPDKLIHEILEP
jgi:hypothetical protein